MSAKPFIQIDLEQVKTTKNMIRYEKFPGDDEGNRRASTPNQYWQQTALASAFGKFPKKIRITVESLDE